MISLKPRDDSVRVSPPDVDGPLVRISPPTHVRVVTPPPGPTVGVVVPGDRGPAGEDGTDGRDGIDGTPGETEFPELADLTLIFENGLM